METTNSSGGILSRFAQGQNIDEPLAESASGATDYYEADGLGSITSLTNGTGTIAQTYTYDSFGNVTHSTGTLVNPLQYTARDFDSETGLSYYRARYYDPAYGRFISEDPMGLRMLNTEENPYIYVRNSPIGKIDPFGLWEVEIGGGDGLGMLIKFGHNSGQWNIGVYPGVGSGLFGSYDPTDQGCRSPGFYGGLAGSADVGEGKYHAGLDSEVDLNGPGSASITIPTPGGGVAIPLPPDPAAGPAGLPHGTLGGGFGGAVGIGGTSYFGGSCGCN